MELCQPCACLPRLALDLLRVTRQPFVERCALDELQHEESSGSRQRLRQAACAPQDEQAFGPGRPGRAGKNAALHTSARAKVEPKRACSAAARERILADNRKAE
jgi:hypothetical protein